MIVIDKDQKAPQQFHSYFIASSPDKRPVAKVEREQANRKYGSETSNREG